MDIENKELLKRGIEIFGVEVKNEMLERFDIYLKVLLEWNKKMNLTAITDEREVVIKHFLDSISCLQAGIDLKDKKAIDVGTGAGFPGVPVKIMVPEMNITLMDSLNKRTVFLTELMNELGLNGEIIHGRAEDYGMKGQYREKYDAALSRAVAGMAVLCEYTLPFVKVGGYLLCMKGPAVNQEAEEAAGAINILGGKLEKILPTNIYTSDFSHYIALIQKVKICPGKYPRKAGTVEKKPL